MRAQRLSQASYVAVFLQQMPGGTCVSTHAYSLQQTQMRYAQLHFAFCACSHVHAFPAEAFAIARTRILTRGAIRVLNKRLPHKATPQQASRVSRLCRARTFRLCVLCVLCARGAHEYSSALYEHGLNRHHLCCCPCRGVVYIGSEI